MRLMITMMMACLSVVGLAAGRDAHAEGAAEEDQSSGPPSSKEISRDKLEEIVVSAQKREERLQDVPMAISAISADDLIRNHELNLQDFVATVPGVSLREDGGPYSQIVIRGLSSDTNPTVGVTIDDVPVGLTNTYASFGSTAFVPQLDPADLERIEVLKGPQGTLYGASSIGGVLRYVTAPPDLTAIFGRTEIDGSTIPSGGGTGYGVRGSVNVPIVADTVAIRASAFHREDPGFLDDPTHQATNFNLHIVTGGRLDSLWQITPALSVRVAGLIDRTEGVAGVVDTAYSTGALNYSPIYGDLQTHQTQPGTNGFEVEHQLYSATIKYHTNWSDLTSVTGLGRENYDTVTNYTGGYGPVIPTYIPTIASLCPCAAVDPAQLDSRKLTQELRLASFSGSTLEWLVGAFYTDEITPTGKFDLEAAYLNTGAPIPDSDLYKQAFEQRYHEYAGFADLTYHFTSQFDVEVGARASHNWQHYINYDATGAFGGPGAAASSKDNSFTYLFTPRFRFSDALMAYARVASGYLPGGPNAIGPGQIAPLSYGPAKSTNYELGLKGSFFERRATVDADIFDVQWSHVQLLAQDPSKLESYVYNGGGARSRGVETDVKLLPIDSLTIGVSAAYTDAILTQSVFGFAGMAGDWLPYGSRWSGSLFADQGFEISSSATGFVGATWAYVGKRYSDYITFNPDGRQSLWPGYSYANFRMGVQFSGYTVTAFVNNVANGRGIISAYPQTTSLVSSAVITPRTVGLSLLKEFK